jgi:pyruvate dehydrogenase E1 component alpha subunit/2-oxoisovalerate dehydrogenase E1 component alpha subunit
MTVGVRPLEIFRQYMAKGTASSRGRDLNIHIVHLPDPDADEPVIVGPISMLGDSIPVAAGIAMGAGMSGRPRVAMAWIGDGAMSTGAFHEGMNFAAVRRIPLVVIGEDNKYAYSTPTSRQMNVKTVDERAASYGVPHELVDGNDMLAVYDAAKRMVDRARSGGGAQFLGVDTMRMQGHAQHDDARYVPKETMDAWTATDPLVLFRRVLLERGAAKEKEITDIDRMTKDYAAEEADLAVDEPMPDPATVARGVYAGDDFATPKVELVKSPWR